MVSFTLSLELSALSYFHRNFHLPGFVTPVTKVSLPMQDAQCAPCFSDCYTALRLFIYLYPITDYISHFKVCSA